MIRRTLFLALVIVGLPVRSVAGGPAFVAGSAFDPLVMGRSVVWANGSVQYYTDQGALSPIVSNAQADALISSALATWTSIPGVALTTTQAGHLAEDVSGTNVSCDYQGNCTMPADIQPSATGSPVGIVYDYDGKVTNALLGQGAGGAGYCFSNAVYGGPDNFGSEATITHALVVINGVCAANNNQLVDVQYRLERSLGRVLGLGWSQANVNVQTGNPPPSGEDFEGFSLMHYMDSVACVPISACYGADAAMPKMDDRAALRRMYPASSGSARTARIHGTVYFTDASGNPVQPMQGVNVVARWVDAEGQVSRQYVATSVSGFAFSGNAGNIINGYTDSKGLRFDQFGSNDTLLEGFFDLGGLEFPDGANTAKYQLSVEAVDPLWSLGVGPYANPVDPSWYLGVASNFPSQVMPSGQFNPITITLQAGKDVGQDILMQQCEQVQTHPGSGSTYANPAALPNGGSWGSWLSGYGNADFFKFNAQAKRTAAVIVTALDEFGQATQNKLMPTIGMWELSDQGGNPAPAATPTPFNTMTPGMTVLNAQFNSTEAFRLGVADFRGDGRPDYRYVADLLYADSVLPARVGLQGGPVTLNGIGFYPHLQAKVGTNAASVISISATQMQMIAPSAPQDGLQTITVTDPATGAFTQMQDVLQYGATSTDLLLLVQGSEPSTPVGAVAANPIRVRAVASDGVTPVSGATIGWSATNGAEFSVCNWATSCLALTDASGEASTQVMPTATGASAILAKLAPEVFSSPQTQQATLVGTESSLDIAGAPSTQWVAQGATIDVPLTAKVLSLGAPKTGVTVNFAIMRGSVTLTAASAVTNSSGFATVKAELVNHSSDVIVSGCIAPQNAPCVNFTLFATPSSMWKLEPVSGTSQTVSSGQTFQPLVVRVTDGTGVDNPILGASVVFDTTLVRGTPTRGGGGGGETEDQRQGMPVILGEWRATVVSDANGLASLVPSTGDVIGACDVYILAQVGSSQLQFELQAESEMMGSFEIPDFRPPVRGGNMRSSE